MSVIVSTLIGGLLALAGAWVGPHFQRKHERWRAVREDQKTLRDKAQELFDELDRLVYQSQKASLAAVAKLKDDTVEAVPVPDLGRVRAIAAIYFPSALPIIQEHEARHQQVMQVVVDEAKSALGQGAQGLETLKALPMFMTSKYQEFASNFVVAMRAHLATEVPKLELEG